MLQTLPQVSNALLRKKRDTNEAFKTTSMHCRKLRGENGGSRTVCDKIRQLRQRGYTEEKQTATNELDPTLNTPNNQKFGLLINRILQLINI